MRKFGAPASRIRAYRHWSLLLREGQLTLGAMVLAAHGPATSWSLLPAESFSELHQVIGDVERGLKAAFGCEKLNYLMLMMVDPHVHFHVIPRYPTSREFAGRTFIDAGWPGPPDLGHGNETDAGLRGRIFEALKAGLG